MTTTAYRVTIHDTETPINLPDTARVSALLGQDSTRATLRVTTTDPAALEAALQDDGTVISFTSEGQIFIAGISDGTHWNAGGQTIITAATLEEAKAEAEEWADEGDYPCLPPATVTIVMRDGDTEIARWQHRVPDAACSGDE